MGSGPEVGVDLEMRIPAGCLGEIARSSGIKRRKPEKKL